VLSSQSQVTVLRVCPNGPDPRFRRWYHLRSHCERGRGGSHGENCSRILSAESIMGLPTARSLIPFTLSHPLVHPSFFTCMLPLSAESFESQQTPVFDDESLSSILSAQGILWKERSCSGQFSRSCKVSHWAVGWVFEPEWGGARVYGFFSSSLLTFLRLLRLLSSFSAGSSFLCF
jgi:hypothetical protein